MNLASKVQSELELSDRIKQLEVRTSELQQELVAEQGRVTTMQAQTAQQDEAIAQQVHKNGVFEDFKV